MPVTNGVWHPQLYDKQKHLLEICREKNGIRKYVLAAGGRWAGKTVICHHAIVDHCWNTKNASVAVIVPSITVGADEGVWSHLTETIIPEWIEGDFGLDWAVKGTPRQSGQTKKLYCYIKNKWGGRSRIELDSLKEERMVERDFKGRNFSMIYVSEASLVKQRDTYTTLLQCLRKKDIPDEEHLFLADANPCRKYGSESFWYQEFMIFRKLNPDLLEPDVRPRQKYLRLVEFCAEENPFISDELKSAIKAEFLVDPEIYERDWLGLWKKSARGALFSGHFKPAIHCVGDDSGGEQEILVPEDDCEELLVGWDFGPANPVVEFCEKIFCEFPMEKGEGREERACFKFFDEIAFLDSELSLAEFTHLVCEMMDKWERTCGKKFRWVHYSDRSAFDIRESIANIYQYQEVFAASGGRIELIAVEKPAGTVPQSIRLWRKLLLDQRLLFAASMCPKLVEMNQSLMAGKNGQPIDKTSIHKHPFDAARYILMREVWQELNSNIVLLQNANRTTVDKVISIPL